LAPQKYIAMKRTITFLAISVALLSAIPSTAQNKMGYIDMSSVITVMPEFKRADTALAEFQNALNQQYADMVAEFNQKDSLLGSKDTLKYNKAQLEIRRRDLGQLYLKIQGWNQQAQQLYGNKESELLTPVQTKAQQALEVVAKENGYGYVFSRQALVVTPPAADDLAPLLKKKLGIK
jgi:outer membrane protein